MKERVACSDLPHSRATAPRYRTPSGSEGVLPLKLSL